MTLYKQLVISISLLFVLMFFGTLAVNIHTTRGFLQNQLASHAQDTATSLGLSLSQYSLNDDLATMELMISAIFDRGYYERIELTSVAGAVVLEKSLSEIPETVPDWVQRWVAFDAPESSALLMSGWSQAGHVMVKSHAGYAYDEFWRTTVRLSLWFAVSAVVVVVLLGFGLRILLIPLKQVQRQAEAVAEKRYEIQQKLPKTKELRSVVTAMNQMTEKVKATFQEQAKSTERMREMAYQDPVTGLGNRRFFMTQLESRVAHMEVEETAALLLIQLVDLQSINDSQGFEAGDRFIKQAGSLLLEHMDEAALTARLAGADFAMFIPLDKSRSIEHVAEQICAQLAQLHSEELTANPNVCAVGGAVLHATMPLSEVLAEADLALRVAQNKGANQWHVHSAQAQTAVMGRQAWSQFVRDIIADGNIQLYAQNVVAVNGTDLLHHEILVRLVDQDGKIWSAGVVIPMAEQFGLIGQLDQLMIDILIQELISRGGEERYAVNLSSAAIKDARFIEWLQNILSAQPSTAKRLIFEFSEFSVVRQLDKLKQFVELLRRMGCGFGLDHFGQAFTTFGYLNSLKPDYVKIDGGFIRQVVENRDDQFFVESLCHVAHSLDIVAIAERVEESAQAQILSTLGVDALQGYLVHKPMKL